VVKEICKTKFYTKAIGHAVTRDGSSGGVSRTAVLTESGVDRKIFNLDTKTEFSHEGMVIEPIPSRTAPERPT